LPYCHPEIDKIYPVLDAAPHFFWHLRRESSDKSSPFVKLEAWKLSKARMASRRKPFGENLYRDGLIHITINTDGASPDYYGYKIENVTETNLYIWMFSFNVLDLSIRENSYLRFISPAALTKLCSGLIHKPSFAGETPDPCLKARGILPVGYGSSGTAPRIFSLSEGLDIDVTFLKLFVSTIYIDLSSIEAAPGFSAHRKDSEANFGLSGGEWNTVCVPVIQKRRS
jgi:hypothetical protein